MYIVARRLARWVGPHAGDAADGELLRRIEVVAGELAGVGDDQAQPLRKPLQAIGGERELAEVPLRTRRGGVARGEVSAMQGKRALREQHLESREATGEQVIARVAAVAQAHERPGLVVWSDERGV